MKSTHTSFLLGALLAVAPAFVSAQIINRTFTVVGLDQGAKVNIDFTVNANTNTVTVKLDNTILGASSTKGTVVGFGFNTPFSGPSFTHTSVAMSSIWTQVNSGHSVVAGSHGDNFWNEYTPYSLSPTGFGQDYGVSAGNINGSNPGLGIQFGEKATFTFVMPDFTVAQLANFLDNTYSSSNTNYDYDFSVRWQQVSNDCATGLSDKGGWDGFPPTDSELPPTPEPSTYGLIGAAALIGMVVRRRFAAKK